MEKQTILIYRDDSGREPFIEWLHSIGDIIMVARIESRLKRIRLGNFGDCKSVGDSIFEFRLHFGPGYRIYFGKDGGTILLLLCGGNKSSQMKDVKKAKQYWKNYQENKS